MFSTSHVAEERQRPVHRAVVSGRRQAGCLLARRSFLKDSRHRFCHSTANVTLVLQDKPVTKLHVTIIVLLSAASPAYAGPCANSIAQLQLKVDAAIEQRANSGPWKPESIDALRSHQPTPRSVAAAEAGEGFNLDRAFDLLDRARAADRLGDVAACSQALANARAELRQQRP
jgi:hypothetical protein